MTLGTKIAMFRGKRKMTQKELAELAEISESYLRKIETGKYKNPHINTIARIATALGVSINDLEKE